MLSLAAALERDSEHPLAEAILEGARDRGLEPDRAESFDAVTGKGVRGRVAGQPAALGNQAMMDELDLDTRRANEAADALRAECKTAMYVAAQGRLAGIVAVADPMRR